MACECKQWMQKKGKKGKLEESMEVKLVLMSHVNSLVIYQVLKSGWETWHPGKWMGYFQEKLKAGESNPGAAKLWAGGPG